MKPLPFLPDRLRVSCSASYLTVLWFVCRRTGIGVPPIMDMYIKTGPRFSIPSRPPLPLHCLEIPPLCAVSCFIGIQLHFYYTFSSHLHFEKQASLNFTKKCQAHPHLDTAIGSSTYNATECPWRPTHIDPPRRQRVQLLTSCTIPHILITRLAHHTTTMSLLRSRAIPPSLPRASRQYSDTMDRHYFQKLGRKIRLSHLRPLADPRGPTVVCCQLHTLLRASHRTLPLDHPRSEA